MGASQCALRRRNARHQGVKRLGLAERARESLELCLSDVVRVAASEHGDVHRHSGVESDGLEHVTDHGTREVATDEVEFEAGGLAGVNEEWPARDVDNSLHQCLIERRHERLFQQARQVLIQAILRRCVAGVTRGPQPVHTLPLPVASRPPPPSTHTRTPF